MFLKVRPPKYGIDPTGINPFGDHFLNFFWTTDTSINYVGVRDIYKLEYVDFSFGAQLFLFNVSCSLFCRLWESAVAHYLFAFAQAGGV